MVPGAGGWWNERGAVRYIDDDFLKVTIIRAESNIGGMVATLLQQLEGSPDEFDGDVFHALKDAVLDPEPKMRGLGLRCISRYPWFQFIKVLEEAASKETMPELRAEQLALVEDIRKVGKRGT